MTTDPDCIDVGPDPSCPRCDGVGWVAAPPRAAYRAARPCSACNGGDA